MRRSTRSVVLDTSVVAKSLTDPHPGLPPDVYRRETETREKIRLVLRLLAEKDYIVYFPRVGLVETASVLRRAGVPGERILEYLEAMRETFIIIDEDMVYDEALRVAMERAPSGFDTYFIAAALVTRSTLITDDAPMARHAEALGVDVILVRSVAREEIIRRLDC